MLTVTFNSILQFLLLAEFKKHLKSNARSYRLECWKTCNCISPNASTFIENCNFAHLHQCISHLFAAQHDDNVHKMWCYEEELNWQIACAHRKNTSVGFLLWSVRKFMLPLTYLLDIGFRTFFERRNV